MEKITGVDFLATAEAELAEAIAWYNKQNEGLGYDFAAEIFRTIQRIVRHPQAWGLLSKRTRRCCTNRFPYAVIYQIRNDHFILIVSIMHMCREPNSWQSRLHSKS